MAYLDTSTPERQATLSRALPRPAPRPPLRPAPPRPAPRRVLTRGAQLPRLPRHLNLHVVYLLDGLVPHLLVLPPHGGHTPAELQHHLEARHPRTRGPDTEQVHLLPRQPQLLADALQLGLLPGARVPHLGQLRPQSHGKSLHLLPHTAPSCFEPSLAGLLLCDSILVFLVSLCRICQ